MPPVNLFEYEELAREVLPQMAYDYYAAGADDEISLAENRAAYGRIPLYYRVLRDIDQRSLATSVLGHPVAMPILAAPTAFHKLAHPEGEVASVRAVGRHGSILILSTLSTCPLEEVVAAATGPVFFQLYVYRDRGATRALVERAEAAGCKALVLTVDAQLWGRRERDVRNRFRLPPGMKVRNLTGSQLDDLPEDVLGSGLSAYVRSLFDPALSWQDIEWLASISKLPVVLKGIVHPEDGRLAAASGAAAVIVSNHGGRQVDTSPATIEALPRVVDAVKGKIEVWIDGGIRRGTDVIKALARGARAVAVGRPVLWGLATGGEEGVYHALELLRSELDLNMGLCGCRSPAEIGSDLLL
jgi:4-hydroxymandelate oxidase